MRRLEMDNELVCAGYCKKSKPQWQFRQKSSSPTGHEAICRECRNNKIKRAQILQRHKWDEEIGMFLEEL